MSGMISQIINKEHTGHLTHFDVPLCPLRRHLLYVCGLATAYRHPELSYMIKDPEGKGNTCSKLLVWNETVVSKGYPFLENQRPQLCINPPLAMGELSPTQKAIKKPDLKIVAAREKKDKQNLAKTQAKRADEGVRQFIKRRELIKTKSLLTLDLKGPSPLLIFIMSHPNLLMNPSPLHQRIQLRMPSLEFGRRMSIKRLLCLAKTLTLLLLQSQLPSLLPVLRTRAPKSAWPLLMFNKESVSSFIHFNRSRLSEFDPSQLVHSFYSVHHEGDDESTTEHQFVPKLHTSVGYRKSLAALMKVSLDVPAPAEDTTRPSTKNDNDVLAERASLKEHTTGTAIVCWHAYLGWNNFFTTSIATMMNLSLSGPSGRGPMMLRPHWSKGHEEMMDVKRIFDNLGTEECIWHESHLSTTSLRDIRIIIPSQPGCVSKNDRARSTDMDRNRFSTANFLFKLCISLKVFEDCISATTFVFLRRRHSKIAVFRATNVAIPLVVGKFIKAWVGEEIARVSFMLVAFCPGLRFVMDCVLLNRTSSKEHDTSSRSGNDAHDDDADIRPIYDEEPMAEEQMTTEIDVFAIGQQHTEQPEFNNEGEVVQNAEEFHDTCLLPAIFTDN
nr:hypothetical protein [Tanacetum cinerariifolium]